MSITSSIVKQIKSLHTSSGRSQEQKYIIEGKKMIDEWMQANVHFEYLIIDEKRLETVPVGWHEYKNVDSIFYTSQSYIDRISTLKNPSPFLAVVSMDHHHPHILNTKEWTLAVDRVQDPGNWGTIIRIADWFGIPQIIYNEGTVDIYNPKVIQATMGSLLRVQFHKLDLIEYFSEIKAEVYAAVMNGKSIYDLQKDEIKKGIILLGNESKGIDEEIIKLAQHHITIPKKGKAESLNVSVACGIICSHLCR